MRMIVAFTKAREIRYIGHLDLMRTVQRALRRSGLPLKFSNGFNPHILLSFAVPLSVGVVGLNEWMDVPLSEAIESEVFAEKLNAALPRSIRVTHCIPQGDKLPPLMSLVAGAEYHIDIDREDLPKDAPLRYAAFAGQDEIMTIRKTKSGERLTNIKKFVLGSELLEERDRLVIKLSISNEKDGMLKPSLWFHAFCEFLGIGDVPFLAYRDCILGCGQGGKLMPLEKTLRTKP